MQVLSNAVTLRYTWIKSPDFCQAWADSFDSSTASPPTLTDLHVILAANRHYWDKTFHWGDKQKHWKELNPLVTVAQNASYPIYLGTIDEPVAPNPQCQFQVVAWDSLPTPTTNGPIQLP